MIPGIRHRALEVYYYYYYSVYSIQIRIYLGLPGSIHEVCHRYIIQNNSKPTKQAIEV